MKLTRRNTESNAPKPKKRTIDDLCHTSQEDMERIINGATIPTGASGYQVTRHTPRRSK